VTWRRLCRDRWALAAAAFLVLFALVALAAPLVVDVFGLGGPNVRHPGAVSALGVPSGPSGAHPFGVDDLGRDVLARVVYGARVAIEVGLLGAMIATVLGAAVGLTASFTPPPVRMLVVAGLDACMAVPAILLGVGIGLACGADGCADRVVPPGRATVIFAVAVAGFGAIAPEVMRVAGDRRQRPVLRLCVAGARVVPAAILLEAALGFLDVGVRAPNADWGQMIASAGRDIASGDAGWWGLVFPGLALVATVFAFGLLARGVERAVRS
jgi:ABC-type dipeptide/oligopeptide/nickel transport system permease subunit